MHFQPFRISTRLKIKLSRFQSNNGSYKACCCDERCAFVESLLTCITSILSRTLVPTHALWKPRKSSLICLVLHRGAPIHARPSTRIPKLSQRFSISQILQGLLMNEGAHGVAREIVSCRAIAQQQCGGRRKG